MAICGSGVMDEYLHTSCKRLICTLSFLHGLVCKILSETIPLHCLLSIVASVLLLLSHTVTPLS